ncbi:hypothetical protein pb186bvf_008952 [Paramecium bursaria]
MNFFSFLKTKKESPEDDYICIYLKSDFKSIFKVKPQMNVNVHHLIGMLISSLNLSEQMHYQLILVSHIKNKKNDQIVIKRRLHDSDKPFKILEQHQHLQLDQSLFLDYLKSHKILEYVIKDEMQYEQYNLKIDCMKKAKSGWEKVEIKFNDLGILLSQQGKLNKFMQFSKIKFQLEKDLEFSIREKEKTKKYKTTSKEDYYKICKIIKQLNQTQQINNILLHTDDKIYHINNQRSMTYQKQVDQCISGYDKFKNFPQIDNLKKIMQQSCLLQHNQLEQLFMDDSATYDNNQQKILRCLSLFKSEQYRDNLIKFNPIYQFTAAFKLEENDINNKIITNEIQSIDRIKADISIRFDQ